MTVRRKTKIEQWAILFLLAPLIIVMKLLSGIYFVVFKWWLDARLVRKSNEALAREVCKYLGFLFTDYGARFVPNGKDPPAAFDFAQVTLSVGDLIFQICRGRGEINLTVASLQNPTEFHEFSTVLGAMDVGVKRQGFEHLLEIEEVLKLHMNGLGQAFSAERYLQTKAELLEMYARDRIITKQWETEINRRLYE